MTTPPVSDDEFYAQFRQGLEQYPEQPEDPAVWQRMKQVLDAEVQLLARRRQRRRQRWFGGSLALLALLCWTALRHHSAGPSANGGLPPPVGQENSARTTGPKTLASAHGSNSNASVALAPVADGAARDKTPPANPPVAAPDHAQNAVGRPGGLVSFPPSLSLRLPVNPPKTSLPKSPVEGSPRTPQLVPNTLPPLEAATDRRRRIRRRGEQPQATSFSATAAAPSVASPHGPIRVPVRETTDNAPGRLSRSRSAVSGLLAVHSTRNRATPQPLPLAEESTTSRRIGKRRVPYKQSLKQSYFVPQPIPALVGVAAFATSAARAADAGALSPLTFRFVALRELLTTPPDSLATVALVALSPVADTLAKRRPPLAAYRLRLGLVGAPELSTVRADRLVAPGSNVGLQFDYLIAPRWHLNVGYLQTVKRYAARGTDYHPPAGYVPPHSTWRIDDVNANCRIADIPINLRYDWWQRPGYQVFASVGLSSLLMQREVYTYTYEQISGITRPPTDVEVLDGSRHVLQILNLSAGYERAVGRRWTMQAEPFVKLPLGGIGFGAVRLSSAGVFFSLRYGLLPARP